MLEKPRLADEAIAASLRDGYGVTAASIAFLPIGNDADAWVYRIDADDGRVFFFKVKRSLADDVALAVPRSLQDAGIDQVVAPLPTATGALRRDVDDFSIILYPFVDGQSGMEAGLSLAQWAEFGATLARIHAAKLPPELTRRLARERFVPSPRGSRVVNGVLDGNITGDGDSASLLAALLDEKREEIRTLLRRTEELGRMLRARPVALVVCHADVHTANVVIDAAGRLFIVDWDRPMLAPRERDLMFAVGPAIAGFAAGSADEAAFFAGYGPVAMDPVALAYYRYEWAVQDIGDYAERVLLRADLGEETRRDAVRGLREMFDPGQSVEAAFRSEGRLTTAS